MDCMTDNILKFPKKRKRNNSELDIIVNFDDGNEENLSIDIDDLAIINAIGLLDSCSVGLIVTVDNTEFNHIMMASLYNFYTFAIRAGFSKSEIDDIIASYDFNEINQKVSRIFDGDS